MPAESVSLSSMETLTLGLAVQELHAAFGPGQTYLFGSRARGTAHPESNLDVLHVPKTRTAPPGGSEAALDHVEERVLARGGTLLLGIQIVPDHMFEDYARNEPRMKGVMQEMKDARKVVVENLEQLSDASILRARLADGRPGTQPALLAPPARASSARSGRDER